jgi:mannose-6-phosphate isomerase-like protein (cupin superfamily)
MKVYRKEDSHLYCGHWNGSPVEIGITEFLNAPPRSEILHYHEFYEYYVVLHGKGKLNVENDETS